MYVVDIHYVCVCVCWYSWEPLCAPPAREKAIISIMIIITISFRPLCTESVIEFITRVKTHEPEPSPSGLREKPRKREKLVIVIIIIIISGLYVFLASHYRCNKSGTRDGVNVRRVRAWVMRAASTAFLRRDPSVIGGHVTSLSGVFIGRCII